MKRVGFLMCLLPSLVFSSDLTIDTLKTKDAKSVQDSGIYAVSKKQFPDDVTTDQDISKLILNADQLHQAKVWDLTEEDEKRYVFLMQNRSPVYYADRPLSPTEILGLNARTQTERDRFATLAAEQNEQQLAQLLAWRNTYQEAYEERTRSLPVIKPFDTSPFSPYHYQAIPLKSGDNVYFYLRLSDPVKAQLAVLYRLLAETPHTTLNLYFLGDGVNKKSIDTWAKAQALPSTLVKEKRITLAMGKASDVEKINQTGETLPIIVHESQGKTALVKMSRF